MKLQKAYVKDDGTTVLKCPFCNHARTVSVAMLRTPKKIIRVKCTCQQSYSVELELRKMFRRSINLKGKYISLFTDNQQGRMIVKDISIGGIGFETEGQSDIEVEDELEVTFTLDDTTLQLSENRWSCEL